MGHWWGAPNSNYLLVMVPIFVMPFSITLNPRMIPGCCHQVEVAWLHQGFRYKPRQLCLNIHTHWKVGNCMGKCIKSLDAFHRIEPCSYTASYTQHLIVLSQLARYLVSLPSIIPSTETDSSSPKSKISHERISLKLTADRSSSLRVTCRTHARTFIKWPFPT